jgi:hypothetical protein
MQARTHAQTLCALVAIASLGAVAVAGCRGVIGIEDVTLVDGGAHDGGASQGDALPTADTGSAASASIDTGAPDTGVDAPASTCGATTTSRQQCAMCCNQETPPGAASYINFAEQGNACACQACNVPCPSTSKVCGGTTALGMTQCGGCVVSVEIDTRCPDLASKCDADSSCKKWAACVKTCAPLPP